MFCVFVLLISGIFCVFPKVNASKHYVYFTNTKTNIKGSRNLSFCLELETNLLSESLKFNRLGNVIGETFVFKNIDNISNKIFSNFGINIFKRYFLNNKEILLGKTNLFDFENVNGMNVQMSISSDEIVVGFPIIYGEY